MLMTPRSERFSEVHVTLKISMLPTLPPAVSIAQILHHWHMQAVRIIDAYFLYHLPLNQGFC